MPASTPRRAGRKAQPGSRFMADVLADNLRAYRLLRRLEQTDIADGLSRLGHRWTRASVSQVERGQRNVTLDELLGLAEVLSVPIPALLDPMGPDGRGRDGLDHAPGAEPLPALTASAWVWGRSVVTLKRQDGSTEFTVEPAPEPPVRHTTGALAAFTSDAREEDMPS